MLARSCDYADCSHTGEQGCALAAAVSDGRLPGAGWRAGCACGLSRRSPPRAGPAQRRGAQATQGDEGRRPPGRTDVTPGQDPNPSGQDLEPVGAGSRKGQKNSRRSQYDAIPVPSNALWALRRTAIRRSGSLGRDSCPSCVRPPVVRTGGAAVRGRHRFWVMTNGSPVFVSTRIRRGAATPAHPIRLRRSRSGQPLVAEVHVGS